MKRTILGVALALLFTGTTFAEGPVIASASKLNWDYDLAAFTPDGFQIYLSRTSGIVPASLIAVDFVIGSELEWAIVAAPGQWYAVVTAVSATEESGPSNEIPFFVLPPPVNLRVQ